jgi:exosortase
LAIFSKLNILALAVVALFVVGYLPVWQILFAKWAASDEYTHAFLTLPIILYIIWSKRKELEGVLSPFSLLGLPLVFFATLLYIFALLSQVPTLIALAMLLTLVGVVVYLVGPAAINVLAVPLLLFAMLIPVPEQLYTQLTFPLQLKVSQASEIIIRLFGVTIFRDGNIMHIPTKSFEVVEACSGMRSMITLMTLSIIMGYFMLRSTSGKILLLLGSIPAAILVNLLRVVAMVLLYHFFGLDLTAGTLHTVSGLAVFIGALLILFVMQQILEAWELNKKSS